MPISGRLVKVKKRCRVLIQVLMQKYDIKTGVRKLTLETKDEFAKKWETVIDEFFINTNRVPDGLTLKSAISA